MTPLEYMKCYTEMQVPTVRDDAVTGWQKVTLNKYQLVGSDTNGAYVFDDAHTRAGNLAAMDAMNGKVWDLLPKKGVTLAVYLGGPNFSLRVDFTTRDIWYLVKKAYLGKGSAEEVQMALQLADRFNLLQGGDLQTYADNFLGLDCNGFVGNYLVHGIGWGGGWNAEPAGKDFLANKTIDVIVTSRGTRVRKLDDLVPANSYLMAMVGFDNQIIKGGGSGVGHVLITEPIIRSETPFTNENRVTRNVPTLLAVESTGGVGLVAKDCQILDVQNGIFSIKRLSHPEMSALNLQAFRVL